MDLGDAAGHLLELKRRRDLLELKRRRDLLELKRRRDLLELKRRRASARAEAPPGICSS